MALLVWASAGACRGGGQDEQAPMPVATEVRVDRTDLLFRYDDGRGGLGTASRPEEVPEPMRREVVVVDTSRSPEARGAADWVELANLSAPSAAGTYPTRFVRRSERERGLRRATARSAPKLIMYATDW